MKLSIITINRNNAEGLRKTMESVLSQTYRDFEYIIVDGASTDNSVEVIKSMAPEQDMNINGISVRWISELDTGIYNAMNKGIKLSTGEYSLMLNSADYLVNNDVVDKILPLLDGTDIIQGNTLQIESDGQCVRNKGYARSDIDFLDVQHGYFLHQASFCKRSLFEQFGYFDETYKYVSDTIFFIKTLGYGGCSFKYIDIDVSYFDLSGFSNTSNPRIREEHRIEEQRMQQSLFPGRLYDFCRDVERKVIFYNQLKAHRWRRYIAMLLIKLSRLIYGPYQMLIKEKL